MKLLSIAAVLATVLAAGAGIRIGPHATPPPDVAGLRAPAAPGQPPEGRAGTWSRFASRPGWNTPQPVMLPAAPALDPAPRRVAPPPPPAWIAVLQPGDTFDAVLRRAGMPATLRQSVIGAMQGEYDLGALRPGDRVVVQRDRAGRARQVTLSLGTGERIIVQPGDRTRAERKAPVLSMRERGAEMTIEGSVYAAVVGAGVPASLAVDLATIFEGSVDFRSELQGGETLRLLWRENRLPGGTTVGAPELTYARLGLADALYEVVRGDGAGSAYVFRDGERVTSFAASLAGGRLTSVFGRRKHPIYGDMRMHTGVDFAAARNTPVLATASGRVSFVGWRRGYGRVVEIDHKGALTTMYTHLAAFAPGLERGDRVAAGDRIGAVGSSGLATGPNLHFELRLDGRPVDPMDADRMAALNGDAGKGDARRRLEEARRRFAATGSQETEAAARPRPSDRGGAT